jgi:hypothetical protein
MAETGRTFEKFTLWPKDNPYKTIVIEIIAHQSARNAAQNENI